MGITRRFLSRLKRKALWSSRAGELVPLSPISIFASSRGFSTSETSKRLILTPWYQAKSPSSASMVS